MKADTIQKCFRKCGFTDCSVIGVGNRETDVSDDSVICDSEAAGDPQFDTEDDYPLAVLELSSELFGCEFKDLLDIDDNFSIFKIRTDQPLTF